MDLSQLFQRIYSLVRSMDHELNGNNNAIILLKPIALGVIFYFE